MRNAALRMEKGLGGDLVRTLVGEAPLFSHRLLLLVTSTGFRSWQRQTQARTNQHRSPQTSKLLHRLHNTLGRLRLGRVSA